MLRNKALTIVSVMFLVLGIVFISCTKKQPEKTIQEVKIGYINPFTGDAAAWGEEGKMALAIALEEIDKALKDKGLRIKIIYEDTKASPKEGINIVKKLIDIDKVPLILGPAESNVGLAIAPVINQAKVTVLATGCTAAELTEKGGEYFFRVMPSDALQARIAAKWVQDLGYKNIALLYVENSWGIGLKDAFSEEFKNLGGGVSLVDGSNQDARDFRTQLSKVKKAKVDAIYAPLYPKAAGLMLKQLKEMGLKIKVIGADVYSFPELREAAGDAANGVLYTTFGAYKGKEYQEFAQKFKEKYKTEPSNYSCYNYDAMKIAALVIKNVLASRQQLTGENIQKEMVKVKDFMGATGNTTFDKNGDVTAKTFDKMMIKDGKVVPYTM